MTETTMSLEQRLRTVGLQMKSTSLGRQRDKDGWEHDAWRCQILRSGRGTRMTVTFRMGTGHLGRRPTLPQVLESLLSDAASVENAEDFKDWADGLGYDTDSRRHEQTYRACIRQTDRLRRLLDDDYETFLWHTEMP